MIVYHEDSPEYVIHAVYIPVNSFEVLPVFFVDKQLQNNKYENVACCLSPEEATQFITNFNEENPQCMSIQQKLHAI